MATPTSVMPDLPDDIVMEILSWMPVKSLLQFRTVCKSWKSIISNSKFVEIHLDRIANLKRPSFIVSKLNQDLLYTPIYLNSPTNPINLQPPSPFLATDIISSCNGIVCLGNDCCNVIYLWNPSTKQSKSLPGPLLHFSGRRITTPVSLGFGFDPTSKDYKVLRIIHRSTKRVAELYSTNADSWKEIQVQTQIRGRRFSQSGTFIKGVLYWISNCGLVSFELETEVFGVVQLPSCLQKKRMSGLLEFEGSVAMIVSVGEGLSLWMMTDVSGKVSWTKQFTFYAVSKIDWVFLYLSTGQFVAVNLFESLILYDYKKEETVHFQLSSQIPPIIITVINYTESLVSIKGFKQVH